ncbi:hypothetical protein TSAR_009525 [Trichomalopsis sarcophagae]|uniref:Uncharacterized protein n=1 Tax=Trichomalopsis sarcophagae TaxID=543379 RepID=A0A232F7W2_9HYME|nr:hypothetical protein TSAR_009525 [Trichomalopsis sarcophagae]
MTGYSARQCLIENGHHLTPIYDWSHNTSPTKLHLISDWSNTPSVQKQKLFLSDFLFSKVQLPESSKSRKKKVKKLQHSKPSSSKPALTPNNSKQVHPDSSKNSVTIVLDTTTPTLDLLQHRSYKRNSLTERRSGVSK